MLQMLTALHGNMLLASLLQSLKTSFVVLNESWVSRSMCQVKKIKRSGGRPTQPGFTSIMMSSMQHLFERMKGHTRSAPTCRS